MEIEPDKDRQIKTLVTFAGMTIKDSILCKTLSPPSAQSPQPEDTTARLLDSPMNAKRLRAATTSQTPEHPVFETTEDLKRALGI